MAGSSDLMRQLEDLKRRFERVVNDCSCSDAEVRREVLRLFPQTTEVAITEILRKRPC